MSRSKRRRELGWTHGSIPGEFRVDPSAPSSEIAFMHYSPEDLVEGGVIKATDVPRPEEESVVWIDVLGLGSRELILEIAERFGVHGLALEDVAHGDQRPKFESYGDQLFVILQSLALVGEQIERTQMSLIAGPGYLLTFGERGGFDFEPVKERLRIGRPRLRKGGPGYLTYALLDAAVDQYFPVLEDFQEGLERLEMEVRSNDPEALGKIERARSSIFELRRAILPARDVTRSIVAIDWPLLADSTRVFLRDCHDHALVAADQLEICREIAGGLMDIHLSSVSNQANETMKVLTVIATIFMPLSFIAGLYGMNFDPDLPGNMPELGWPFGYVGALGLMAAVAIGLLAYFRRKGWF